MATEQSILALIAYDRFANGDTFLYNMSDVTAVANPTVPDPVIEDVTLTDVNGTGVTAAGKENVLKDNMELEANLLTSGDQYDQAAQALGEGKFTLYDLYLLENNLEIQPDGTITLAIPVPEGYDGASCKVYRIGEDGSAAEITAVLKDGKLSFETSLMGMFAVWQPVSVNTGDPDGNGGASHPGAGEEDDSTSHLGANGDTGTPGTGDGGVGTTAPSEGSDGTSNPKTGDASSYVLWLWGLMLSAAMVLLASHKKKQRD